MDDDGVDGVEVDEDGVDGVEVDEDRVDGVEVDEDGVEDAWWRTRWRTRIRMGWRTRTK